MSDIGISVYSANIPQQPQTQAIHSETGHDADLAGAASSEEAVISKEHEEVNPEDAIAAAEAYQHPKDVITISEQAGELASATSTQRLAPKNVPTIEGIENDDKQKPEKVEGSLL